MKKFFSLIFIPVLILTFAGGLFPNGLNLNGVGSKASAMGTAFVGLSDDFSAVFFNPAGLTQLKDTTLTLFVTDLNTSGTYNFELLGVTMADAKTIHNNYPSGALAYFKPISDKLTVGIAGYVPSAAGSRWSGNDLAMLSGGHEFDWTSTLFMISVSPAAAYKINDKFSIGASLNIDYAVLNMDRPAGGGSLPDFQYSESLSGIALGATIGLMYKPMDNLSVGLTWKTPVKASIKGKAEAPAFGYMGLSPESDATRSATWPMWLAAGVAFKPFDNLTITADVTYNNWKKMQDIPMTFDDPGWKAAGMEHASELVLKWKDTVDIKFGVEYQLNESLALRGGFYTDGSPSPEETLNIMLPSIHYNAFTFGLGYKRGKIGIDLALEYVSGDDRYVDPMNYLVDAGMPGTHGMTIVVPNITVTYTF